ncbi:methionine--tRNA ligase [Paenibacillus sacheonensis]|uniref:Methionine--tRNA ligase n=1 Tax=Paenibacillus sacheonensis TaxID=742054 RepID=A0A7X5BYA6_9BACL|nr:methionine--tRNA ligase [Paenibacillus sacheonensis]MBM7564715.1 methionyl-tRNA synthetase [Paenibacillus sacheonensis]NBC69271.1 methionine--tRNA ligase [Paenibacillus sacheonensis]
MPKIFIGGAWPYANGSLHLGRLASLLPGDVLARYYRLKGEDVLYVSGSDCHGTPVAVQALQEGVPPSAIADRYHAEFAACFEQLGFTYDLYTRTDQPFHHNVVRQLFLDLLANGYLYKKTTLQTYCETDRRFLPDRYVEGICPVCGSRARGDQCDTCSTLLDPSDLTDKTCKLCGNPPVERETEHYYLALSKFQSALSEYAAKARGWKDNAVQQTKRYLEEGLQDRAATRDLTWGVDVPLDGFEEKKIYVWIEAVSGYLSACKQWSEQTGGSWEDFWLDGPDGILAYYVHGKDNIPFHSLVWPAILMGAGGYHLPDRIISSEYMTLEGKKFSTSGNWAVWVPDVLSRYQPDSIRYFLLANGPEKRDTDFSWREFIHSHNGELLGAFGNFVNRTLAFVDKSFEGIIPEGSLSEEWRRSIEALYATVGLLIEQGRFKEALESIFDFVRSCNKFYDERKPWVQIKTDPAACGDTLHVCTQFIVNLSRLLSPFLPFACERIRTILSLGEAAWEPVSIPAGRRVEGLTLLYQRIDAGRIEEETGRLDGRR